LLAVGRELTTFDKPLDEWHIREPIDNQLQPAVVYRTPDGERGVDAVRDLVDIRLVEQEPESGRLDARRVSFVLQRD
jgi:hypothetical protein